MKNKRKRGRETRLTMKNKTKQEGGMAEIKEKEKWGRIEKNNI